MLIGEKLNEAMNAQIGSELGASNQYLQIAAYFDSENLPVLAALFFRQAEEEREHAMKFVRYILETGGAVAIPAIEQPPHDIGSAEKAAMPTRKARRGQCVAPLWRLANYQCARSGHRSDQHRARRTSES